jgi:FlaA1/EpsC-like NDP-sugar epimerase
MTPIAGKAVLVTGASGSLGLALVRRLCHEAPSEIRALQRTATAADELRRVVAPQVLLRIIGADVADSAAVAAAMEGIDLVFHLAAQKDVVT